MKKILILSIIFFFSSCDEKHGTNRQMLLDRIEKLESKIYESYKPGFGELMSGIQNHHAKLWFAGINENWELAAFEIHEIGEVIGDVEKFQSERKETKSIKMFLPYLESISKAVGKKDIEGFKNEYIELTKSCNECHKVTEYDFIKVIIPTENQFSSQKY